MCSRCDPHGRATTGFREADHYGKTIQRLTTERDALRAEVELVREIVGAEEGEDTVAAVCWWLAERDHYERLAERYRAALEEIRQEVGTSTLAHKIAREALAPTPREERADGR